MIVCLYYCLRYPACKVAVLYCHLWSVRLHQTFPQYLTNDAIFGTKLLHIKYVLWFSLQFCPKYLSFLKEFREIFSYRHKELRVKCPLFLFSFNETWIFSRDFQRYSSIKFDENLSSGSGVVPCGQRDGRGTDMTKLTVRFSQFCEGVWKLLRSWRVEYRTYKVISVLCVLSLKVACVFTTHMQDTWVQRRQIYKVLISYKWDFLLGVITPVTLEAGPSDCAVWVVGLLLIACWDCGFESHWGYGCPSVVSVVCVVRYRSLRRADHSSRGAISTVVRMCVWSRNLVNEEAVAHLGLLRQKQTKQGIKATKFIFKPFSAATLSL